MNKPPSGFETELRISLRPAIVLLLLMGLGFFLFSIVPLDLLERFRMMLFAVLVAIIAGIAWMLDNRRPLIARWFIIWGMIALIFGANYWFDLPELLALFAIPVGAAAILINIPVGSIIAVIITALLLFLSDTAAVNANLGAIIVHLITIWATLGMVYIFYRTAYQMLQWSWNYYQQAHILIEESRERTAEREQALSDLAKVNTQLTRLNNLAQNLRLIAEDARASKERFVANISHELRTPLHMIIGFSEMILQSPIIYGSKVPSGLLADLEVIHRNAEHLSDLIDDVLDLSQIEADELALTREQTCFDEIVDAAVTAVQPLYISKGIYLEVDVSEDLPGVFCDSTRIREVMLNLLSNAGRFTEQGGVLVKCWQQEDDLVVSVADTGAGITAEDMEKLFQPFQQLDASIRRRYGGTGLGLSISKRFIELHEGEIWVKSDVGIGTTFFFSLPLVPSIPTEQIATSMLVLDYDYKAPLHPSRIPKPMVTPRFVVLETGDALKHLLSRYWDGVDIVPVTSLEEATISLSHVPAQALLINNASVSTTLKQLNASPTLPDGTPTIICSIPGVQEASTALGVSDFLTKPISQKSLLGALDRLKIKTGLVLVVDDEPDSLHMFGRMLASSERGYRVLLARDGQEALNILHENHPDVILLDLIMPNVDGFQLLELRSQTPAINDIPVIIISARDPAGQPIVSKSLAVVQEGGLSLRQLLKSIETLSGILSVVGPIDDLTQTKELTDQRASG